MEQVSYIPDTKEDIQKEIESLLDETPSTSTRGRLCHLFNALFALMGNTTGGAKPLGYIGTFTCTSLTAPPFAYEVDNGTFAVQAATPASGNQIHLPNRDKDDVAVGLITKALLSGMVASVIVYDAATPDPALSAVGHFNANGTWEDASGSRALYVNSAEQSITFELNKDYVFLIPFTKST